MKRVLFLTANLCSGGAEHQMVTIASLLKQAGCDVTVYCYNEDDFFSHILEEAGVTVVWEIEPSNYLRRIRRVVSFIRHGCYDAVISFLPTCNFLNDLAAFCKHNWLVITGERSSRSSTFLSAKGKLFAFFQSRSDIIVCNSHNAARLWANYYPSYKGKLNVIYNAIQLGPINTEYVPKFDGKLHIIVGATFQFLKNPLKLVEALSLMSREERDRVVIDWYGRAEISRGDKRAYDETCEAIVKYEIGDVLVLHPDTKNLTSLMNLSDVVMLLSTLEGLPNVICEGMALGKPIIMTRVSDYDVLVDDTNGFLCDSDSPESIKVAILKAASLPIWQLIKMGESSYKKAFSLFSEEKILSQWLSIINGRG